MGFRIPLSSCGGSLFISVRLRKVALHRAKELLLLLDVLLLSPSACLPVKPKSNRILQEYAKNRKPTCRVVFSPSELSANKNSSILTGYWLTEINAPPVAQISRMHSQQTLKKSPGKLSVRDH